MKNSTLKNNYINYQIDELKKSMAIGIDEMTSEEREGFAFSYICLRGEGLSDQDISERANCTNDELASLIEKTNGILNGI